MPVALHPAPDTLAAYGLGRLADAEAVEVARHLGGCPDCSARVADLPADSFLSRLRAAAGARAETPRPTDSVPDGPTRSGTSALPESLAAAGQYADIRELGRGGMGVVYLARNTVMDRPEVLKVVTRSADRFVREIQAAARLKHPNVVAAYAAHRVGDRLVFAMEYVPGEDLGRMVKTRGPLPVADACRYAAQAALGLQHAHDRGMVHRDVKPSNLMLTEEHGRPVVKVLDFGLAKGPRESGSGSGLTGDGAILGTPAYIAPEQTRDATRADRRSDVYSLGCTLYHLLAGHPPFRGTGVYEVLSAHQTAEAPRLTDVRTDVPPALSAAVARMMAKDPAGRYPTAAAVASALQPFFDPPARRPTRPALALVGMGLGLALAAALAAGWAAGVLRVKTPQGTLVLENLPADTEVLVDGAAVTVTRAGDTATVTLRGSGPHGLTVRQGGRDLHSSDVTVPVGGEPIRIRVDGRPARPAGGQPIPKTPPTGRPGYSPLPAQFTNPVRGPWETRNGELVNPMGTWGSQIAFGDPAWTDYDFSVEAMRTTDRQEPFGLIVRAADRFGGACVFAVGAFLGDRHFVGPVGDRMLIKELAVHRPGRLQTGRWYAARVEVRGARAKCYLDGRLIFDVNHLSAAAGCVGLHTWYAPYRFRSLKVTDPAGKVLFDGLPDLATAPKTPD